MEIEDYWRRAVAINQDGNLLKVFIIDKGSVATVNNNKVRELPRKFRTDFFCHKCRVKTIDSFKNQSSQKTVLAERIQYDKEEKCYYLYV